MLQINYNSYYQVFTLLANVHLLLLIGNVLILTPLFLTLSVLYLFPYVYIRYSCVFYKCICRGSHMCVLYVGD